MVTANHSEDVFAVFKEVENLKETHVAGATF